MLSKNCVGEVTMWEYAFYIGLSAPTLIVEGKDRLCNQMGFIPKLLEMDLFCGAQIHFLEFFPWHIWILSLWDLNTIFILLNVATLRIWKTVLRFSIHFLFF